MGALSFLLDGDDGLGVLHTGHMLDGAGDAQGHIDARMHGLAGLADLMIGGQPARIGHSAGSAHDAAQHAGQLFGQGDALFNVGADAAGRQKRPRRRR